MAIGLGPRAAEDGGVPPALPRRRQPHYRRGTRVRSVFSLLGGIAISISGILVVVRSTADLAGVLLITAGVVVALLGPMTSPQRGHS
jgi:hypothetical protein